MSAQNIDTLEHAAGVTKVLNCHGSFARAYCLQCGYQAPGDSLKDEQVVDVILGLKSRVLTVSSSIFACRVPLCPKCTAAVPDPSTDSVAALARSIAAQAAAPDLPPIPPTAAVQTLAKPKSPKFSSNWDDDDDEEDDLVVDEWAGKPIMKPTITFFGMLVMFMSGRALTDWAMIGEKLSDDFDKSLLRDRDEVDLLLVLGTSLKVNLPLFALIPCRS